MKSLLLFIGAVLVFSGLNAQDQVKEFPGKVSYITAQNIYVRFDGSTNVQLGDTLYVRKNGVVKPLLIIESKSSLSCMGKPLNGIEVSKGEEVFAQIVIPGEKAKKKNAITESEIQSTPANQENKSLSQKKVEENEIAFKQKISGRITASTYASTSSGTSNNSTRFRYNLSLRADHIGDSRFSADTYVTFTHLANDWSAVQDNLFSALKIYSMAVKYQPSEQSQVWFGRKINPKLSSIGAIDGLQYEAGFKNFRIGAVVGFRPDYSDYSVNTKLLEYGGYLAHEYKNDNGILQNSLAFFEQKNNGKTDRRFAYFQHNNSLLKNLFFFVSSEIDLYKLENGIPTNTISLTSLYVSMRYRISRQLSLNASYDTRKNVIYYETFKSLVDQLLEEASRQGVQFRINYRPMKFMNIGLNAGYRVRDNDPRPTKTFHGFVSFSHVPWLDVSATLSANLMQTSYVDGQVFGLRFYKDLFRGKLYSSAGYRYVDYNFINSGSTSQQHVGELDLTWRILKKLSLSANYEGTFEKSINYTRIYINLTKRF